MKAIEVWRALKVRHPTPDWIFLGEVRTRTGFQVTDRYGGAGGLDAARSIDAFAMHTWSSKGFRRVAYEIKVSRADWKHELADPKKRAPAYFLSNQFYFAFAPGVFRWEDVNLGEATIDGAGLLEIHEDGTIKEIRRAAKREAWPMPDSFIASLLRQAAGVFEKQRDEALAEALDFAAGVEQSKPQEALPLGLWQPL
jgi:hypothetical protein